MPLMMSEDVEMELENAIERYQGEKKKQMALYLFVASRKWKDVKKVVEMAHRAMEENERVG